MKASRLLLRFEDPSLEARYDEHLVRARLWRSDEWFMVATAAYYALVSLQASNTNGHRAYYGLLVGVLSGACAVKRKIGREQFAHRRTLFVACVRACHQTLMAFAQPHMCFSLFPNFLTDLAGTILVHDVLSFLIPSLAFRLKFYHHLLFNTPVALLVLSYRVPNYCDCALSPPGSSWLVEIEGKIDSLAQTIMTMMYAPYVLFVGDQPTYPPCIKLVTFLQVFSGIFLSAYALWHVEMKSRNQFLEQMSSVESRKKHMPPTISRLGFLRHIVLAVILFAGCWEYSYWLPGIVQKWGMLVLPNAKDVGG